MTSPTTIESRLASLYASPLPHPVSALADLDHRRFAEIFDLPAASISISHDGDVSLDGLPLSEAVVLLMMKTRLADLDAQVREVMTAINDRTAQSSRLQNKIQALQAVQAAVQARQGDSSNAVRLENVVVEWEGREVTADVVLQELGLSSVDLVGGNFQKAQRWKAEYEALSLRLTEEPGSDEVEDIESRMRDIEEFFDKKFGTRPTDDLEVSPNMRIRASALASAIQRLQSDASELNNGNELQMVRMQSAMSQRAQVITMGTQMLKTMSETAQQIARNL